MKLWLKLIIIVVVFGLIAAVHRTMTTATWLVESNIAAEQVEDTKEPVVALEVTDQFQRSMGGVFAMLYVLMCLAAIGWTTHPLRNPEKESANKDKKKSKKQKGKKK